VRCSPARLSKVVSLWTTNVRRWGLSIPRSHSLSFTPSFSVVSCPQTTDDGFALSLFFTCPQKTDDRFSLSRSLSLSLSPTHSHSQSHSLTLSLSLTLLLSRSLAPSLSRPHALALSLFVSTIREHILKMCWPLKKMELFKMMWSGSMCTHSLSHTSAHTLSLTHTHTHAHVHKCTHTRSRTHTHTHKHTPLTHTNTNTVSLCYALPLRMSFPFC